MIIGSLSCDCCDIGTLVNPNSGNRICIECGAINLGKAELCYECRCSKLRDILSLSYGDEIDPCPYCSKGKLIYDI